MPSALERPAESLQQPFQCTTLSQLAGDDGHCMVCLGLHWTRDLKRLFTEDQPGMPQLHNSTYDAAKHVIEATMPEPSSDSIARIVHECCDSVWSVLPQARETVEAFYSEYRTHVDSGSARDLEVSAMRGAVFSTFFQGAISATTRAVNTAKDAPSKHPLAIHKGTNIFLSSLTVRYGYMKLSTVDMNLPQSVRNARAALNVRYSAADYDSGAAVVAEEGSMLTKLIHVADEELAIDDPKIVAEVHERGRMTRSAILYRVALDHFAPNITLRQISPDIVSKALQCFSMGVNLAEWGPRSWMNSLSRWEVQQFLVGQSITKLMADRIDIPFEEDETGNTGSAYSNCGTLLVEFANCLAAVPARPYSKLWAFALMYEMFGERHDLFARYMDANGKETKAVNASVLDEMRASGALDSLCGEHAEILRSATDDIRGVLLDTAAVDCPHLCEDAILLELAKTAVLRETLNAMLLNPYCTVRVSHGQK
ncbi:unnamed protein product [Mortierella alpina]